MKKQNKDLRTEGEKILFSLHDIERRLSCVRAAFDNATEEALIDSYIYEIISLHKKYEYFLCAAREMGLTADLRKIG